MQLRKSLPGSSAVRDLLNLPNSPSVNEVAPRIYGNGIMGADQMVEVRKSGAKRKNSV